MITIYNTLSRKKEEFKPLQEGKVEMYVCGPTVYDVPHIGHARSAYVFDVIRRYFAHKSHDVLFVRNVTDVDDKIINKATQELKELGEAFSADKLKDKVTEVAERYLEIYHRELEVLNIDPPTKEPKATENIEKMIKFIEVLIEKGYAYPVGANVYFSVEKFSGYGKLSNQNIDEIMHGVRKDVDENKQHPLDFALWKEVKKDEPSWASPWGEGRPGWHIECSVMSTDILGHQFDIHGGGLDLIFPHHENEIAQAEAATGKAFANYWMHNGLLSVDGEKMSKSLGNFITIEDFLKKYKDPDLLKIFFLNSHYRSPVDYGNEKIEEAKRSKERIMIFINKVNRLIHKEDIGEKESAVEIAQETASRLKDFQERFEKAMNDDFNTPSALAIIFEAVKAGNEYLSSEELQECQKIHIAGGIRNFILRYSNILGLSLSPIETEGKNKGKIDKLVQGRTEARKSKDFARADEIRSELDRMGIVVEDTPEGPIWRRK